MNPVRRSQYKTVQAQNLASCRKASCGLPLILLEDRKEKALTGLTGKMYKGIKCLTG